MSVQAIFGRCNLGTTNTAQHWAPTSLSMAANTVRTEAEVPWAAAGSLTNWRFELTAAPGGAVNRSVEVLVNNSVVLTLTWTPAQTVKTSSTVINLSVGDLVTYRFTCNVGPVTANCIAYVEFTPTTAGQQVYGSGDTTFGGGTNYQCVFAGWGVAVGIALATETCPVAGDLKRLEIRLNSAPAGGSPMTYEFVKNGVVQDGAGGTVNTTTTITSPATTATWTGTLTLAAGDTIAIKEQQNGNSKRVQYGVRFDSTTAFVIAGHIGLTSSALSYIPNNGGAVAGSGTQANVNCYMGMALRISKLYATIDVVPGGGNSRTVTFHKNSTATNLTCTFGAADLTASDLTHNSILAVADVINFTTTNGGSPTNTNEIVWAVAAGLVGSGGGPKNSNNKGGKGGLQIMSPGAPLQLNYGYGTSVDNP